MISKVPFWSSSIKPIRLKEQQNRLFHILHRSSSSNVSTQGKLVSRSSKTWKVIYVSNLFIVLSDLRDQKNTYIYNQQSYKIYESNKIYQLCVEVNEKLYLFFPGKSLRYQVDIFENGNIKKVVSNGYRPLLKNDCLCSFDKQKNCITIYGKKLAHQFQITSPFWRFNINTLKWEQMELQNSQELMSSILPNTCIILSKSYLYAFQLKKLIVYNINDCKIVKIHETRFKQIKSCISTTIEDDKLLVCLNNETLVMINGFNSFQMIDMGVFLDQTNPLNLSAITMTEKQIKVFGEVEVEPCQDPSYVQVKCWMIELSELCILKDPENIGLLHYFNKKNYSDLIFLVEGRQIYCSRLLFQHFSPKFKKLYINSNISLKSKGNQSQTTVKVDNIKYPTLYFLIEQLYNNFKFQSNFDQQTFLQLMQMSNKFQIRQMQTICQKNILITNNNFAEVCDFYLNNQTNLLKDRLLKYLVTNYMDVVKKLPVGKAQELIRGLYSPQCSHNSILQLKSNISNYYVIKRSENQQKCDRNENIKGLVEGGQVSIEVCQKCFRIIGFDGTKKHKISRYTKPISKNQ